VATVGSTGLVTGLAPGNATIVATSEGVSGTAVVTVIPPPVATVQVILAAASIPVGSTIQASAILKDVMGHTLGNRTVSWSSSNQAVATVNSAGIVSGVAAGNAVITATSEGISGTAPLTVLVPPTSSPYIVQFVYVSPSRPSNAADQTAYVEVIESLANESRFLWLGAEARQAYSNEAALYLTGQRSFRYYDPADGSLYPGNDEATTAARAVLITQLAARVGEFYSFHTGRQIRLSPLRSVRLQESAMFYKTPVIHSDLNVDRDPPVNKIMRELTQRGELPSDLRTERTIHVLLMDGGGGWAGAWQWDAGAYEFGGLAVVGDVTTGCLENARTPGTEHPLARAKWPPDLARVDWLRCNYNYALGTIVHELGHTFGLPHPADFECAGLAESLVMQSHWNADLSSPGYFRRPAGNTGSNVGIMKAWDAVACRPTNSSRGYAAGIGTTSKPNAKYRSELEILLDNPHFGAPATLQSVRTATKTTAPLPHPKKY
jgi:hypothetical protein